jgi:hypothetical protein
MNMAPTIIRIILTILLLVGVYSETGIWTTVAMTLICISKELTALFLRRQVLK